MVMDYVLNPIICTIICSKLAMNYLPGVPYPVWVVLFAALFTGLNLRGVKQSARTNEILAVDMGVVVVLSSWQRDPLPAGRLPRGRRPHAPVLRSRDVLVPGRADRRVGGRPHLHRLRRHLDAVGRGREPAPQHPARDRLHLPRSIGMLSALEVYAAQLVWGTWNGFPDVDTAFVHVARQGRRARGCSWSSTRPCSSRTSAQERARSSARRGCSTAWAAAAPCRDRSSARSTRRAASPATTCCSWASSRSSAASCSATSSAPRC